MNFKKSENNPQPSSTLSNKSSSCVQGVDSLRKDLGIIHSTTRRKPELFRKKSSASSIPNRKSDRKKSTNAISMAVDPFVTGRSNLSGFDLRL
ncbi:hypothetical protein BLA29_010103 [Euroglyphus maynei]|uniref:Uncharacterized protein n=1 Tax=Euroglyphus maynei TaxID=6958 RepID=A0A1Y3AX01_EURMA|nr:hypothetical protein BLA29_010103 [Euroglyphus maynei]